MVICNDVKILYLNVMVINFYGFVYDINIKLKKL